MSTAHVTPDHATFSPHLTSVLPMFYVGWSDSVLSPSEMSLIDGAIDNMHFLSAEEKQYLHQWTDPQNPPPPAVFEQWLVAIRTASDELSLDQRLSLADIGYRISKAGTAGGKLDESTEPKTFQALQDLAHALGVDTPVSARILRRQLPGYSDESDAQLSFSPEHLLSILDDDMADVNQRMRKLLRDPVFELKHIADKHDYRQHILQLTKELARQGVSGYSFPKAYGGGERTGDHIAVFEMLAYGDLSLTIKFGVQFGLFGGALFMLGSEKHHRLYVEPMHRAELLGCFAMTETGHGSNVRGLETTATYDSTTDEIVIHSPSYSAGKEYIGNPLHSEMAAVFAQLIVNGENHGVHAVLVPLRDTGGALLPGVKVEDCGYKVGLNGVDNGRIWFDQVRVPRANLLDRYGSITDEGTYTSPITKPSKRFFTMLGALVAGRICVGLASISATKKSLAIATKYALHRRQFAPKDGQEEALIMDYPTHMERIIPAIATTYGYHFALRDLAKLYGEQNEENARQIETMAAGLKSKATWHATKTIQVCREACGGKGYLAENQIAALKADTDIFTTFEGDNTVLMQLVAKGVLTEFKQSFHDDGSRAVLSFLLKKAGHRMSEYNFINKRNDRFEHLTSQNFLTEAFEYRYEKLMIKLSERMRKYLKRKMDGHEVFLKTQIHLVDLADAYIDHLVLQSYADAISGVENEDTKNVLQRLYTLFGLDTIYQNRGWYLENDFMDGTKTKAIRKVRMKLMQDLRPDVGGLVDAFGIPDELVKAPIALNVWS
ncbi:MAG: acyl-CoA dehydrogenase [Bacteroidota bacterium]